MKRRITPDNWTKDLIQKQKFTQPSKTIPDQALSVREIMLRNQRGVPVTVKEALYHDEKFMEFEDGRNPATMDISEITAELQKIEERIHERREQDLAAEAEKRKKLKEQAEEAQRQKWIDDYKAEAQKKQEPK